MTSAKKCRVKSFVLTVMVILGQGAEKASANMCVMCGTMRANTRLIVKNRILIIAKQRMLNSCTGSLPTQQNSAVKWATQSPAQTSVGMGCPLLKEFR